MRSDGDTADRSSAHASSGAQSAAAAPIDREAQERIDAIAKFIDAAAEDAACTLPFSAAMAHDAACVLADFGRFLERNRLGGLTNPAAHAWRLYLHTLRDQRSAAQLYVAASVLHLVYGHWPWTPKALRHIDGLPM